MKKLYVLHTCGYRMCAGRDGLQDWETVAAASKVFDTFEAASEWFTTRVLGDICREYTANPEGQEIRLAAGDFANFSVCKESGCRALESLGFSGWPAFSPDYLDGISVIRVQILEADYVGL